MGRAEPSGPPLGGQLSRAGGRVLGDSADGPRGCRRLESDQWKGLLRRFRGGPFDSRGAGSGARDQRTASCTASCMVPAASVPKSVSVHFSGSLWVAVLTTNSVSPSDGVWKGSIMRPMAV
jgi:hypothetical protein